jgi:lysophospholipase L1-like esterase
MEAVAVAQFRGANRLSILLGDSLSMWFPREKMPTGKLWLNQGISGDTSSGVLKRLSAFSQTRPDVIYIMAGINDLRQGVTDETILNNHRLIIRRLRRTHPQTQIFLQSILPTRLPTISNNRIRHINHQLALIAQQQGVKYLDLHHWFTDFQGNLREDYTTDGLHLSKQGYGVWSSTLQLVEAERTLSRVSPEVK